MTAMATDKRTPYPVAARELLRDTLLDGASDLLQQRDWSEITMADIATAAGVSRQTLYSEFGSRPEFAQAIFLREADRFLMAVEQAVNSRLDDPVAALAAAFEQAAHRLAAVISAGWPQVDEDAIALLAECVVRLAISYAALPKGPAGMTAASVATLLGPYLERVVAEAA